MRVENKTMYHLHKSNVYDNLWKAGNTLTIDDNFNGYAKRVIDNFSTFSPGTLEETLDVRIRKYLLNKELEQRELVRLLIDARAIIHDANIFKREMALETVRKEKFSHLPSRKHSLFVTDKKSIDFWKKALISSRIKHNLALFELSLTGDLFKTSAHLLPYIDTTYEQAKEDSGHYWNPSFTNIPDYKDEYLFQGKATIIKQLKM